MVGRTPRGDGVRTAPSAAVRRVVAGRRVVAVVAFALLGALAWAFARGRAAARDVPISTVTALGFVGPSFVDRRGLATGGTVAGELDDLSALASASFDPDEVDPAVRAFYERTGEYRLRYRATWHRPFRVGAALATRLTRLVEQLNLPPPGDADWHDLESRFVAVAEPLDPALPPDAPTREDVRAWTRTDPVTGAAVFVALYATHRRGGERLVNVAVPLPGGNVSTVMRPELLDGGTERGAGVRFTTEGGGDAGLYLRTPLGPVKLPAGQEFRVFRSGGETEAAGPDDVAADGLPALGAVHEMRLRGRRFLTVDYELVPERVASDAGGVG